jgi:hypothetical protein
MHAYLRYDHAYPQFRLLESHSWLENVMVARSLGALLLIIATLGACAPIVVSEVDHACHSNPSPSRSQGSGCEGGDRHDRM